MAQAAQGLPPDQQARVSQMMAQVGPVINYSDQWTIVQESLGPTLPLYLSSKTVDVHSCKQSMRIKFLLQMGGSGGQQAYGSASYQGATHPSAAASYNAGSSQSAYGTAQPAAQTYPQGQIGTYAAQQSPSVSL